MNNGEADTDFTSYNAIQVSNPKAQTVMLAGLLRKAATGDPAAVKLVMEIAGM